MQGFYYYVYGLVNWFVNLDFGSHLAIIALMLAIIGLSLGFLSFIGRGGN